LIERLEATSEDEGDEEDEPAPAPSPAPKKATVKSSAAATGGVKQINNVKYDKGIFDLAETASKDGEVSLAQAEAMWKDAQDGRSVTPMEVKTLKLCMSKFKHTDEAKTFLEGKLDELLRPGGSYYVQMDGVRYERSLLQMAKWSAKDGQISVQEAKDLVESAMDGPGGKVLVTETERRTLEYICDNLKFTKAAKEYFVTAMAEMDSKDEATEVEEVDEVATVAEDAALIESCSTGVKRVAAETICTGTMKDLYEAHFMPIRDGVQNGSFQEQAAPHLNSLMTVLEANKIDAVLLGGFKYAALEDPASRSNYANSLIKGVDEELRRLDNVKRVRTVGGA